MVFWFRYQAAFKRLGGCKRSSGKAPGARPMTCFGNGVAWEVWEAGAGMMVGGAAAFVVVVVVVEVSARCW